MSRTKKPKVESKSSVLRKILYRVWEQQEGIEEFEDFYNAKMDKISNHFKSKLI